MRSHDRVDPGPPGAAAISSLTASSRIGAPTGAQNRFTSYKVAAHSGGDRHSLQLVSVECLNRKEVHRTSGT